MSIDLCNANGAAQARRSVRDRVEGSYGSMRIESTIA
jgi:hypothetical protein